MKNSQEKESKSLFISLITFQNYIGVQTIYRKKVQKFNVRTFLNIDPVILELNNNNKIDLISYQESEDVFEVDNDQKAERTSWRKADFIISATYKFIAKIILIFSTSLILQGCASAGVALSSVVTSPKLLVYATHKSYDKKVDINLLVNNEQKKISFTIKCVKEGLQPPNAATMSWKEKWKIVLLGNEFSVTNEKYSINLGYVDPKYKIYDKLEDRNWCKSFLKDSKMLEKVNNDNSLVLNSDADNFYLNEYSTYAYKTIENRSFLYITKEEFHKEKVIGSDYKYIAKNIRIKGFKIYDNSK